MKEAGAAHDHLRQRRARLGEAGGYAIAPFLPRRPWAWIYGIVVIGFSALGGCFFLAIPLLYFWVKPETRAYFGGPPPTATVPRLPGAEEVPPPPLGLAATTGGRPKIWPWYVGLCIVSGLLYLAIGLVGIASFLDPELAGDPVEDAALGGLTVDQGCHRAAAPVRSLGLPRG